MYKIETHLHTAYVSKCGWLGATPLIKAYSNAGYSAIAITDHYNRDTFNYTRTDLSTKGSKAEIFLDGYYRLKDEAEAHGIIIYEGAELRFDESNNDFLLFGYHHELLADPEAIIKMGLEKFRKLCVDDGAVLIQAHPFRKKCTPAPPELIDGLEVLNLNPRHENQNDLAAEYAQKHGLLMIGGSDCHRPGDEALCGIISETLPKDTFEFAKLLRSRNYSVFGK